MKTIIQEAQIYGPITYFSHYVDVDVLTLEKYENYQKRSYRNRYKILTSNGVIELSIPLTKGKNNQQIITDVTISYDENWPVKHLQTIRSAYGKSPYFDYYFPDIERVLSKRLKFLFDLNWETTIWAVNKLKLPLQVSSSLEYVSSGSLAEMEDQKCIDLRIKNNKKELKNIKYVQVWEDKFGFTADLSILDLLFCMGPEASPILKKMTNK